MRQYSQRSGAIAGILLPVGMICLFAFCSLALALMGGRAYKNIQQGIDDSYGSTVAASYLRTKLSQNNEAGSVSLRSEGDTQLLVLEARLQDAVYETRIFMVGSVLREAFVPADTPFNEASGIDIAQVSGCRFDIAGDGLFTAEIISAGQDHSQVAFLLAGEGGGA